MLCRDVDVISTLLFTPSYPSNYLETMTPSRSRSPTCSYPFNVARRRLQFLCVVLYVKCVSRAGGHLRALFPFLFRFFLFSRTTSSARIPN